MEIVDETCEGCRFDGAEYTLQDVRGSLRALSYRWRWTVEGIDPTVLAQRPAPAVWSAVEYLSHSADVTASIGMLLHHLTAGTLTELEVPYPTDAAPGDPPPRESFNDALARLEANALRLDRKIGSLDGDEHAWGRTMRLGDQIVDGLRVARHGVHDNQHHLSDVGRGLASLGAGAGREVGMVEGLFASGGGVPKAPIDEAVVGYRGVAGDQQAARQHHGRVWQALCVWSADVVEDLQAEGHPIAFGAAGENISVRGIDWTAIRPGTRVRFGEVLAEFTCWSPPCTKNKQWFVDGDFHRMDHDQHPGTSRAYASVLRDGVIRVGDHVEVEPAP